MGITFEQAQHLSKLINDYTLETVKWRELETTLEAYEASKRAVSSYLASLVIPGL